MGEEMPPYTEQLPQTGVDTDVSNEPEQHVEVTQSDGEQNIDQDIHNSDDGRIEDVDKAQDTAEAGDELRTYAAQNRANIRYIDEYQGPIRKIAEERPEFSMEDRSFINGYKTDSGSQSDSVSQLEKDTDLTSRSDKAYLKKSQEEQAQTADERATRIEEWVGVLHDHPVSEDFLSNHPEIKITARSLAYLEITAGLNLSRAEELREAAKKRSALAIHNTWYIGEFDFGFRTRTGNDHDGIPPTSEHSEGSVEGLIEQASSINNRYDREKIKEQLDHLKELENNPETTLGQLTEFYSGLVEEVYVKPVTYKANVIKDFLKFIKSGRASETQQYFKYNLQLFISK